MNNETHFSVSGHLFERISVGLETDFDHFERVHNNGLSQAWAKTGCRQRLGEQGVKDMDKNED